MGRYEHYKSLLTSITLRCAGKGSKALRMYRPDGKWRTVVDFKTNSVPQGVRDRAFEEWEQIIIDNALLLNAD